MTARRRYLYLLRNWSAVLPLLFLLPAVGGAQEPASEDVLPGMLRNRAELTTHHGLDQLLTSATVHGNSNQDSTAMSILLYVREESRKHGQWDTYASGGLALANLYQKMGRRGSAKEALDEVEAAIYRYGLDSIYPPYAIRKSYWNRSFSKDRDTAIYYAEEALRTAPRFRDSVTLVSGHMLMGFLTDPWPETSIAHFKQGIALCREIGDYVGTSYMYSGLATRMMAQNRYQEALMYNDSSILAARRALRAGQESDRALPDALQARGEIFYGLGKLDSAYVFMHEGHDLEIDNLKELQHQKALEVDARYNDQLKAARIAEQARQLHDEERRVRLLLLVIGLALVLGLVLAYTTVRFRKLNRKNREQAEELRNLDAVKSRFFANVSHELRTPLTLIQGPISSMREDDNLTERQGRLLELAIGNGKKLQELIDQILELQKLEAGMPELAATPTRLHGFFYQCVEAFSSLAQQKDLDYYREIAIDPAMTAPLDREKCRIVLANLLANAFKFTPYGGKVVAVVTLEDSVLMIEVSDTGPGIHPDDVPKVFDRYYQTKRTDRPVQGGTGIGLALCKEYINLFGGTVRVDSRPGRGTSFYASFPLEAVPAAAEELEDPVYAPGPLPATADHRLRSREAEEEKPCILVVEDNTDLQDYLHFILSDHYRVATADNGKKALECLEDLPDCRLVLSDIMMPVMDGYELLDRLKGSEATRHLPVIMLTARGDASDRLRALRIGVDDYLTKPFEEEELRLSISNLLKNQEVRATTEAELQQAGEPVPAISEADREWLERFEGYVSSQIPNSGLTVPDLAATFNMSDSTLLRQVKRLTGLTTLQYIQDVRLTAARRHLEAGTYGSIAQLADAVGYRDARSFSRAFRNRFDKLPSEYSGADADAR